MLGVDFAGGDKLTLSFTQKMDVGQLRAALAKGALTMPSHNTKRTSAPRRKRSK